jgi:small-conductance mechanosensitive channel
MTVTTNATAPLRVSRSSLQQLFDEATDWVFGHWLQVAIACGIGALIVLAMLGLRALGAKLCQRKPSLTHWPLTIGRVLQATRLWFMIAFAARLVDGYADPPPLVAQTILVYFTIASALQGALWVREFILGVVEHRAGSEDHAALGSAIGIIRLLVTITLFAIAGVLILDNLGVNVTGLIAGLGIGGIAIGLAAKGIFDDLFSALSIIFDRPFRRGDSIKWDKTSGTVEAIGLKTTRIRAVSGEEVVISNSNLLNKELHNMARLDRRRVELTLNIPYHTPPEALASAQGIIRTVLERQELCRLVRCGIVDFTLPVIQLKVEFDVQSDRWDAVFQARHDVAIALLAAFEEARIPFAGPDGKAITPPVVAPPAGAVGGPPKEEADPPR